MSQQPEALRNASATLDAYLNQFSLEDQEVIVRHALDRIVSRLKKPQATHAPSPAPVAQEAEQVAAPAMVPLTDEQMVSAIRPFWQTDALAKSSFDMSRDEYRAIESASAKLNGLTVGGSKAGGAE